MINSDYIKSGTHSSFGLVFATLPCTCAFIQKTDLKPTRVLWQNDEFCVIYLANTVDLLCPPVTGHARYIKLTLSMSLASFSIDFTVHFKYAIAITRRRLVMDIQFTTRKLTNCVIDSVMTIGSLGCVFFVTIWPKQSYIRMWKYNH